MINYPRIEPAIRQPDLVALPWPSLSPEALSLSLVLPDSEQRYQRLCEKALTELQA